MSRLNGPTNALWATYQVEVPAEKLDEGTLMAMAEKIGIGQTVGTAQAKHDPTMAAVMATPVRAEIASRFTRHGAEFGLAHLTVSYPAPVVSSDLGTLLAVVFGKISMAGKIRLVNVQLSPELATRYGGPRLGIAGIRQRLEVTDAPLLMGIFKPCLGLPPEKLAGMLGEAADAGVHLIKDDEVVSDPDFETARRRLAACLEAAKGRLIYAINLSGPAETLLARAQTLAAEGAECFLFNAYCYGLPMLHALRNTLPEHVALMAHPALGGAFYGSPMHGLSPEVLFGTLPRWAGADLMLFPSPYGTVSLPHEEALAIAAKLTQPDALLKPAFPVPSAGIQASMVPQILADFGSDVIVNAGTGIFDHAGGIGAAVTEFRKAMETYRSRAPIGVPS